MTVVKKEQSYAMVVFEIMYNVKASLVTFALCFFVVNLFKSIQIFEEELKVDETRKRNPNFSNLNIPD